MGALALIADWNIPVTSVTHTSAGKKYQLGTVFKKVVSQRGEWFHLEILLSG